MTAFTIRAGAATLAGERAGSGPPALILHGGPGLSDYTASLAGVLAGQLTTIRYTQRGLAPSSTKGPFAVDDHVADAVAVLDGLEVEAAWLIGHSWGGHLAMHVAAAQPARVLGLVPVDALGAVGDGGFVEFGAEMGARFERLRGRPMTENDGIADYWPCYFADAEAAPPVPPLESRGDVYAETFDSIREHFAAGTLEQRLPELGRPTLLVHGCRSPLPVSASRATAALIPGARLEVLDGCGHFPWLERPDAFAAAVANVL